MNIFSMKGGEGFRARKTVGVVFQRLEPEFCKRKVKKEQEVQHEHDFIRRTAHEHEKQNS